MTITDIEFQQSAPRNVNTTRVCDAEVARAQVAEPTQVDARDDSGSAQVLPTVEPSEERPDVGRDESGRFRRGNTAALTHGLRSKQVQHGLLLPPGAALPAERAAAVLADLGDVSTITRGLVHRYAHLELVAEWLEGNLLAQGALTTKGHRRAAVDAYLGVVDRLARLGSTLGLERRTKPVQSASAIIAEAAR
jgi:hypothetical protein